jgi:hypothetical protein
MSADQTLAAGQAIDPELSRRHHWHHYFLALKARNETKANFHRKVALELERDRQRAPAPKLALVEAQLERRDQLAPDVCPVCHCQKGICKCKTPRAPSTLLINREHVRRFLLETAKARRAHKFSRVSEETIRLANEMLRHWCVSHVNRMPSKGQTL